METIFSYSEGNHFKVIFRVIRGSSFFSRFQSVGIDDILLGVGSCQIPANSSTISFDTQSNSSEVYLQERWTVQSKTFQYRILSISLRTNSTPANQFALFKALKVENNSKDTMTSQCMAPGKYCLNLWINALTSETECKVLGHTVKDDINIGMLNKTKGWTEVALPFSTAAYFKIMFHPQVSEIITSSGHHIPPRILIGIDDVHIYPIKTDKECTLATKTTTSTTTTTTTTTPPSTTTTLTTITIQSTTTKPTTITKMSTKTTPTTITTSQTSTMTRTLKTTTVWTTTTPTTITTPSTITMTKILKTTKTPSPTTTSTTTISPSNTTKTSSTTSSTTKILAKSTTLTISKITSRAPTANHTPTIIKSLISTTPLATDITHSRTDVKLEDIIKAGCSSSGWNISVDMSLLKTLYPETVANNIFLGDNSCRGDLEEQGKFLLFQQGFRNCLTSEQIKNGVQIYTNDLFYAVYDENNPFIIRQYRWTYSFECDVSRNEMTSGHVHHDIDVHHSVVSSHHKIEMTFFKDPNYMQHLPGNPIHIQVGDDVYVKVFTLEADWSMKMRLHTCYTKPSQDSDDSENYFVIKNGCENDSNTHIISQSTHETRFVFQDFVYSTNKEGLNMYCNVTFCDTNDYSPGCAQACIPNDIQNFIKN